MDRIATRGPSATPAPKTKRTKLWLPLPLTIVWVLLSPFAMILSVLTWWLPAKYGPLRGPKAAIAIGGLLFALSGTIIEVRDDRTDIFILIF
jgi:hypothetical protein